MPTPPTLNIDVLVNGTSICDTKAICVAANVGIPATFIAGADIPVDALVQVISTLGDVAVRATGLLILRPYLGLVERSESSTNQTTIDVSIDASRNSPPEFAEQPMALLAATVADAQGIFAFIATHGYKPVSLLVISPSGT